MSRFRIPARADLVPYVPGEQPRERTYIKLNTNESPYPPSPAVLRAGAEACATLARYPDPTMKALRAAIARELGVGEDMVLPTNGSDEILSFAFAAFCDADTPAVFPDVTYGFYRVFADVYGVPYRTVPLREDFTVAPRDYAAAGGTVFLANPNAPTGIALTPCEIEAILEANPDSVVVVDEAYVEFGAESAISLLARYENLLVTRTFSKSCSMAGARLGFGVANPALISDLAAIKDSQNPYNVNSVTAAMGIATMQGADTVRENCLAVAATRERTAAALAKLGFTMTPSRANFLFARHGAIGGRELYLALRERGILVRHFDAPRIFDYNRITVGSPEEMESLLLAISDILEERK